VSAIVVIAAVLAIAGGIGVIAAQVPVHSVLALILTLVALAVLFIAAGAEYMGLLQVIVYAGAVMVMFVFVISLLTARREPVERPQSLLPGQERAGYVVGLVLLAGLLTAMLRHVYPEPAALPAGYGTVRAFGTALFHEHVFVLQLAALLLMVAAVGVVLLMARRS